MTTISQEQRARLESLALKSGVTSHGYNTVANGYVSDYRGEAAVKDGGEWFIALGVGPDGTPEYVFRDGKITLVRWGSTPPTKSDLVIARRIRECLPGVSVSAVTRILTARGGTLAFVPAVWGSPRPHHRWVACLSKKLRPFQLSQLRQLGIRVEQKPATLQAGWLLYPYKIEG